MFSLKGHSCNIYDSFKRTNICITIHLKAIRNLYNRKIYMKEEGTDKDMFVDVGQTVSLERNNR